MKGTKLQRYVYTDLPITIGNILLAEFLQQDAITELQKECVRTRSLELF